MGRSRFLCISVFVGILLLSGTHGANILFLHSLVSYSHRLSMYPLAEAMAARGHKVSYMSGQEGPPYNESITEIFVAPMKKMMDEILSGEISLHSRVEGGMPNLFKFITEQEYTACETILTSPEFVSWMDTQPKIDLVVQDFVGDCGAGIAHKLGAKAMIYNTIPYIGKHSAMLGSPMDESEVTDGGHSYPSPMSFKDRMKSVLVSLAYTYQQYQWASTYEEMFKSALNLTEIPSMYELFENIALVMTTGNYISEQPRALPPMFVSVPSLHVKDTTKPLPKEVEEFINSKGLDGNPSEGFVYISLGTVVVVAEMPQNVRDAFWETIKAFPEIRFLWRWTGEFPNDAPPNLYISKWFPQQDLLAHPKIRGFVSQMGRPSFQEALTHGVPMIAFPVLGDQDFNAIRLEQLGAGVNLEITTLKKTEFQGAIKKIIYDQTLKQKAKEVSSLFQDLPMKPVDTAVWWVEYVLRHNDFTHLKSMGRKQTWYEKRMLDVWFSLFSIGLALIFATFFLIKTIIIVLLKHNIGSEKSKVL